MKHLVQIALFPLALVSPLSQAAAAETVDAGETTLAPEKAVHDVFATKEYSFCHEPSYPLTEAEKHWCNIGAGENRQACPALREVCRHDASASQLEWREPFSFHLPALGLPVRLLLWLLLGLGALLLLLGLLRHFLDHKAKEEIRTTTGEPDKDQEAATRLAREVELDIERLLERSRFAAQAGDFRAAIGDLYAALLRRLEGAGVVRVEPDQTNGDYLREVARTRPAFAPRMNQVVEQVEHAQFGTHAPTRESFEGVWARVTGLLAEHLGVLLVASSLLLLNFSCAQPRADWEHSPSGRAGVMAYLGKRGFTVHERLLALARIEESKADQLVLLPGAQVSDQDWNTLARWLDEDDDRSLILAGGARKLPAWIGMKIVEGKATSSLPLVLSDSDAKRWGKLRVMVPENNHLECQAGSVSTLLRGKISYAAARWRDDEGGRILVLADDHLLRNASLLLADNAAALDHMLGDGGKVVEIAGDLTGLVASNPVQSVERGRLGPALLQLAALLLVFFVCKGARFGRPLATTAIHRRDFAEHVRALGLHYARARAKRHALGLFGVYAIDRLRERCDLHADQSLSALAEAVAARTGRPMGVVLRLFLEARDAGKGVTADRDARDLETVGELAALLEESRELQRTLRGDRSPRKIVRTL